jgi:hypothetical protein
MRLSILVLSLLPISFLSSEKIEKYPPIENHFDLHWSSQIGSASFRTNVIVTNNSLIIGSNGSTFMDYNISDKKSGVYTINRKTGAIINHFANELFGDMDVNGLLLHNNRLYFGNDNEEFLCTSLDGKIIWRNPTSGDIEHEPVLINNNRTQQIVYASEQGEVVAVDDVTGKIIWSYHIPRFSGWKQGDNRALFKVKSHFTSTLYFYTKPLVIDLTGDGVSDLVYSSFYGGDIYAINGKTGSLLWLHEVTNSIDRSEITILQTGTKVDPSISFFTTTYDAKSKGTSSLVTLNSKGKPISTTISPISLIGMGLNSLLLNNLLIVQQSHLLEIDSKGNLQSYDRSDQFQEVDYLGDTINRSRNSYESLISNRAFSYKGDNNCVVILNQYDPSNYGNGGIIEIYSLTNHKVIDRFSLPNKSEFPPIISDIDKDGYLDLLINCYDGNLYCYDLKVKA